VLHRNTGVVQVYRGPSVVQVYMGSRSSTGVHGRGVIQSCRSSKGV
jgi:hypothetical protein